MGALRRTRALSLGFATAASALGACNGLTGASDLEMRSAAATADGGPPSTTATATATATAPSPTSPSPPSPNPGTDASTDAAETGPPPSGDPSGVLGAFTLSSSTFANVFGTCNGERYAAYNSKYKVWVGVRLCSSTRYKIYLAQKATDTFYEIGDGSNGGEDHCELVNPTFTLASSGDITSGNCPTCAMNYAGNQEGTGPAWGRNNLGEAPVFYATWPNNHYTSHWYECGVSIP